MCDDDCYCCCSYDCACAQTSDDTPHCTPECVCRCNGYPKEVPASPAAGLDEWVQLGATEERSSWSESGPQKDVARIFDVPGYMVEDKGGEVTPMSETESIRGKRVRIKSEYPVPTALHGKEGVVVSIGVDSSVHQPENPWVAVAVGEIRYQLRVSELDVIDNA